MILILLGCFLQWLLTHEFYNLRNFACFGFKFTLTIYLPPIVLLPLPSFVLVLCIHLSFHTATLILALVAAQKGEIWWMNIWQVVLLLSLAEGFESSLSVTEWHPSFLVSLPPTPYISSVAAAHQSYLCVSEWKPKERSVAFGEETSKFLWHLLRGKSPSNSLDHLWYSFVFFAWDKFHNWHTQFPGGNGLADCKHSSMTLGATSHHGF